MINVNYSAFYPLSNKQFLDPSELKTSADNKLNDIVKSKLKFSYRGKPL